MSMFEGFPVEVSPAFEGERIRKESMFLEFGGPDVPHKFELVRVKPLEEVEDGKVEVVGPDISELKEGGSYPLGIVIHVAGPKLDVDLESVIERRVYLYSNYVEGVMRLNQRYDIWMRISKTAFKKGLNTFKWIGLALQRLFKAELPYIERMQTTFITNAEEVAKMYDEALNLYKVRDEKVHGMKDTDVDVFYGCTLCQSFAPNHVCTITPQRISFCGALTWLDARASANIDPKGPNFPIDKGRCLDTVNGEYEGVNEITEKKSMGSVKKVYLYSMFGYPMTACGCFECIAFYIPEVDGIAVVHRPYKQPTVNGLTFATMAGQTGGGIQAEGFLGIAVEFMRSQKFFSADGGWKRIVWLPSDLKDTVKDAIPTELLDKIATEKDVTNIKELSRFLVEKSHPLGEKIKQAEAKLEEPLVSEPVQIETPQLASVPAANMPLEELKLTAGETAAFEIVFEGKIKIGKITLKR
jgi:acetyl-CoA decarbonylase/synthase complex subunit beta